MWRISVALVISVGLACAARAQTAGGFEPVPGSFTGVQSFIGEWEVTETLYQGTDREYVERSRRVCEPAIRELYVICRTEASSPNGDREYWWLMNEPEPGVIEWMSFFSNYPGKGLLRGEILADGAGINLQAFEIEGSTLAAGSHQRIRFRSPDEFEWLVGLDSWDAPASMAFGIERAVRVSRQLADSPTRARSV